MILFGIFFSLRYSTAKELISHDTHSNTYNYKYTFSVEVVPICKDNIVCLPLKLAQQLGNIDPLCVCTRVTETISLINPATLQSECCLLQIRVLAVLYRPADLL